MLTQDAKITLQYRSKERSIIVAYMLLIFLGWSGMHYLYVRKIVYFILHIGLLGLGLYLLSQNQQSVAFDIWIAVGVWLFLDLSIMWWWVDKANKKSLKKLIKADEHASASI